MPVTPSCSASLVLRAAALAEPCDPGISRIKPPGHGAPSGRIDSDAEVGDFDSRHRVGNPRGEILLAPPPPPAGAVVATAAVLGVRGTVTGVDPGARICRGADVDAAPAPPPTPRPPPHGRLGRFLRRPFSPHGSQPGPTCLERQRWTQWPGAWARGTPGVTRCGRPPGGLRGLSLRARLICERVSWAENPATAGSARSRARGADTGRPPPVPVPDPAGTPRGRSRGRRGPGPPFFFFFVDDEVKGGFAGGEQPLARPRAHLRNHHTGPAGTRVPAPPPSSLFETGQRPRPQQHPPHRFWPTPWPGSSVERPAFDAGPPRNLPRAMRRASSTRLSISSIRRNTASHGCSDGSAGAATVRRRIRCRGPRTGGRALSSSSSSSSRQCRHPPTHSAED